MAGRTVFKVLVFGPMAAAVGVRVLLVEAGGERVSVGELRGLIREGYPQLRGFLEKGVRFAVNEEFVGEEAVVGAADEVALIGAVSGGAL